MLRAVSIFILLVFFHAASQSVIGASPWKKHPRVNDIVPEFSVDAGPGSAPIKIQDFKGTVVLLNFWATWCPPCIEEMPSMDELNKRFKAKAFTILAISVDDQWGAVQEFLTQLNRPPSFLLAHDPKKKIAFDIFGIEQYPESFLIDKKGVIRAYYQGAINWTSPELLKKLNEIVNEK